MALLQRLLAAVFFAVAIVIAGCGSTPDDIDQSTAQALTSSDVMGFEVAGAWKTSSGTAASTTTRTQGAAALAITAPVNFTNIVSAAIDSSVPGLVGLGAPDSAFAVDLLLPTQQPNPFYFGALQLYVSVPSRNVHNEFLGNVDLTGRPLNVFRTARFTITSAARQALAGATFADMTITVALNAPFGAKGTYILDNLRVVGATAADFQLTASPADLTIPQGGSGQSMISVARTNGFTSSVAFSATGLPAGVTASFAPASTTGATTVVTFSVAGGAATGTTAITIVGKGAGLARAVPLKLTVTPAGDFSVSQPTVALQPGETVSVPVTIDRSGGFVGPITFTLGAPTPGVTGMFTPTTTTGNEVTLVLTASPTAPLGTNSTTFNASGGLAQSLNKPGTITIITAGDFTVSQPTATLQPGETVSVPVTIDRSGGFVGPITFTLGAPTPGVTGMFTPTTTTGNEVTLVLTASPTAPLGTNSTTFNASGGLTRGLNKPGTITIITAGDFTVSQPTVALQPGETVSVPVTIDRSGGFVGPITFTLGAPTPGVTGMFKPTTTTGNEVTLVLTASPTAPLGTNSTTFNASGGLTRGLNKPGTITIITAGDFTVSQPTVALQPGETVSVPVTIDRSGGFVGPITFTLGAPTPGVTGIFTPTTTTGNEVTLVLTASPTAPLGTNSTTFNASGGLTRGLNKAGTITITTVAGP